MIATGISVLGICVNLARHYVYALYHFAYDSTNSRRPRRMTIPPGINAYDLAFVGDGCGYRRYALMKKYPEYFITSTLQ